MGFFQGLSRLIQGKPIFQEDDGVAIHSSGMGATPHVADEAGEDHPDGIIKNNPSTFPVVQIEDFNASENGSELEIRCMVKNAWHAAVIVQTSQAFGQQHQHGVWLQPEQAKEIVIYKGHPFSQQPAYQLQLEYKTEHEGDYFQAVHEVRYSYNAYAKQYEVSNIQLQTPIRDIYG